MPTGAIEPLSQENLLWEPVMVLHFLARDSRHSRLQGRPQTGVPTLSAQAYADVLVNLRLRRLSPDRFTLNLEELAAFRVAELDRPLAEAYASAQPLCLASARHREEPLDPWFVWNVALHRLYGCRVLTNDRARHARLVDPEGLAGRPRLKAEGLTKSSARAKDCPSGLRASFVSPCFPPSKPCQPPACEKGPKAPT